MAFRDGLLQARGQIVFILALTITTAIVIHLETLDTGHRIRTSVEESLGRERGSVVPQALRNRADAALRRAEAAYAGAPNAVENRAAVLAALAGAAQSGALDHEQARTRADAVLRSIEADASPPAPVLAAALSAAAVAFPALQERIGQLPPP